MVHVHKLEAKNFDLHAWEPIGSCPKDGTEFEVRNVTGAVYRARWFGDRVVIDGDPAIGDIVEWRCG